VNAPDPRRLSVPIEERSEVSALLYEAGPGGARQDAAPVLVLAHGAGAGQRSAFMVQTARALAHRGVTTVTFNFPYTEAGRSVPDRQPVLEATWRAVIRALVTSGEARPGHLAIGGKSMGGRLASHVVAAAPDQAVEPRSRGKAAAAPSDATGTSIAALVAALVLLGYPLHPPGDRTRQRVAHLPSLRTPTLVVQGTRDEFGSAHDVRQAFEVVPAPVQWLVIEGGNHSFKVPRGAPRSNVQVLDDMADRVAAFVKSAAHMTPAGGR
jgi:uncharacterized protein